MKLSSYKAILFDGDGVLWKSDLPLSGINPLFDFLSETGIKWALLTNNNTHTVQSYINKLTKFGIPADQNSVFTSSNTTADYLLERFGAGTPLHVVGMDGLKQTLLDASFTISSGAEMPDNEVVAVVA